MWSIPWHLNISSLLGAHCITWISPAPLPKKTQSKCVILTPSTLSHQLYIPHTIFLRCINRHSSVQIFWNGRVSIRLQRLSTHPLRLSSSLFDSQDHHFCLIIHYLFESWLYSAVCTIFEILLIGLLFCLITKMVEMDGVGSKYHQQTLNFSIDIHQQGISKCFDDDGRPKRTGIKSKLHIIFGLFVVFLIPLIHILWCVWDVQGRCGLQVHT